MRWPGLCSSPPGKCALTTHISRLGGRETANTAHSRWAGGQRFCARTAGGAPSPRPAPVTSPQLHASCSCASPNAPWTRQLTTARAIRAQLLPPSPSAPPPSRIRYSLHAEQTQAAAVAAMAASPTAADAGPPSVPPPQAPRAPAATDPSAAALAAFQQYDRNGSGALEVEELRALARDLGLLQGRSPAEAAAWVAQQFALADRKTMDNRLDFAEFSRFYSKVGARVGRGGLVRRHGGAFELLAPHAAAAGAFSTPSVPTTHAHYCPAPPSCLLGRLQVTAPKLLDALAAEMPAQLEQLQQAFLSYASFGAARSAAPTCELDGVRRLSLCCGATICWLTDMLPVDCGAA